MQRNRIDHRARTPLVAALVAGALALAAAPVAAATPPPAAPATGPSDPAVPPAGPVEVPPAGPSAGAAPACTTALSGVGGVDAALDWLACELERNRGSMPGFTPGTTDYGLTLDAVLALTGEGRGDGSAATAAFGLVADGIRSYVTDRDFGDGTERYAGALAKALLVAEVRGVDVDDVGGMDLDDEVRARMRTTGPEAGRFSDRSASGDSSNGFSQALAMLGLSYADGGVPAPAVAFLLDQQCPAGGFRGTYAATGGCGDDAEADTDYTGLAVQALLASPSSTEVDAATGRAVAWLLARQEPSGAFGGTGVTGGVNTNSAAFAAQALRSAGQSAAADRAAAWVATVQLTSADAGSGPGAADLGAIGYDPAALADAVAGGIADPGRDQWRRATAQALLAFEARAFGAPRPAAPPVSPPPKAPAPAGGSPVVRGAGQVATESLPRTGALTWPLTGIGVGFLLAGRALTAASRRMSPSSRPD